MRPAIASVLAQAGATAGMNSAQVEQFLADLVGRGPQASGIDRRTFLQVLGMGTAGVAAALWVPEAKAIVLPPGVGVQKSVVLANAMDIDALRAAFPGPFMTGWKTWGVLDPAQAVRCLSDVEYRLVIARGRRILEERPRRRRRSA